MPIYNVTLPVIALVRADDEAAAVRKLTEHVEDKYVGVFHDPHLGAEPSVFESEALDDESGVLR